MDKILAIYQAEPDWWTDMPEAKPRARCRVKKGTGPSSVEIDGNGKAFYDPTRVELDTTYEG